MPTTAVATPAVPPPESSPSASGTPRTVETRTFAGIEMVWVPPGTFTMGSDPGEPGRKDDERQQPVTVARGFWLGRYEVTKAQWQAVMGTQPWSGHDHVRDDASTSATHVTWDATQGFVGELNARGEGRFRLPTEAEWEYACRAGSTTAYSFGDDVSQLGAYGWYGANTWSVDEKYAHTPGQKLPNTWGLYDMHGNVWEWCQDWYAQEYPSGSVSDPTGPGSGSHRIMRGGGWRNVLPSYRSANRFRGMQADLSARLGFRVCRNADE